MSYLNSGLFSTKNPNKLILLIKKLLLSIFLGRAVALAPISGFVILSACGPVGLSQLASGEVSRVAIGFKAV